MDHKFIKFLIIALVFVVFFIWEAYRMKSFNGAIKKHPSILVVFAAFLLAGYAYLRGQ